MKISLQPQTDFPIVRQLGDHTDPTTYYVRAVVRDPIKDVTLATINLSDNGSGRFKYAYRVPADVSGQGFYIDITTSVYEDSGYTTKASTYSDENETYLVQDRIKSTGGGGGGVDFDWKRFMKLMAEYEKKIPEKIDLAPVMDMLKGIKADVKEIEVDIEFPEQKEINFEPVLKAISNSEKSLIKAISDKEVTEKPNLSPVLESISNTKEDISLVNSKMDLLQNVLEEHIADFGEKYEEGSVAKEKLNQMKGIFEGELSLKKKKEDVEEDDLPTRTKRLTNL